MQLCRALSELTTTCCVDNSTNEHYKHTSVLQCQILIASSFTVTVAPSLKWRLFSLIFVTLKNNVWQKVQVRKDANNYFVNQNMLNEISIAKPLLNWIAHPIIFRSITQSRTEKSHTAVSHRTDRSHTCLNARKLNFFLKTLKKKCCSIV